MAQVPYSDEELSELRQQHETLESNPINGADDLLRIGTILREKARIPIMLLAQKLAVWTNVSYDPTAEELERMTAQIMEFIEGVLKHPYKEALN